MSFYNIGVSESVCLLPEQMSPAASLGEQSCSPHMEWGHIDKAVSVPSHMMSSNQNGTGPFVSDTIVTGFSS